jgi:DNA topoisomerase-3
VGDHHAIIPTGKTPAALSPVAQKVYDAIVTHLIAAFYPACVKDVTTVAGVSNGVPFRARGVRVLEPGWTALYPRKDDGLGEDEQGLPEFRPGESGPHEPTIQRGETVPKAYTEASQLGAMETAGKLIDDEQLKEVLKEKGLGTPATRAAIIETLLERGYITREKKTLLATDLGRYLVALVQDRGLKSPELTGEWEAKLREVERGLQDPRRFMAEVVGYAGEVIRCGDATSIDAGRLGDCPRCGRPVIAGKRGFGCSGWREGCSFVLWREYKGHALGDDQIRQLLQRRVLLGPLVCRESGKVLLQLLDSGELTEIPIPVGGQRRRARKTGQRPTGSRPRTQQREESSGELDEAQPRGSRPSDFAPVTLGSCPLCGSEVLDQAKSYCCSGRQSGCKFVIWKTIAGKRITARTAQTLLKKGRSQVLKGFASKSGKRFEARLRLEGGEVRFDFGS